MAPHIVISERATARSRRGVNLAFFALVALAAALLLHHFESDVTVYHTYGLRLLHGSPHGRLPVEYPALSALVFALPLLLPVPYALGFGLLMAAALLALAVAGWRAGADGPWLDRTLLYLGLGTLGVLFGRYDLLPALASVVAVLEARRQRWGPAWAAAVVGGALKLFPFLLLPGFLIAEWRARGRLPWRRAAAATAVVTLAAALQEALAPGSLLSPLRYELRRGFEFSSVGGSITTLVDPLHLRWHYEFGCWQVVGADHAAIQALLGAFAVVALVAIWRLAWHGRLEVEAVGLAVLSVAVLTDRAFAPQYLIWLIPLWALWRRRASWVAAAVLTTLAFPVAFGFAQRGGHYFIVATLVAAARNAALCAGTFAWFVERLKSGRRLVVGVAGKLDDRVGAAHRGGDVGVASALALREGRSSAASYQRIEGGATSPGGGG